MDDLSSAQIEELCAIIASKPSSNQSKDIFGTPNFAPRKNFASLIGVDLVFQRLSSDLGANRAGPKAVQISN
jgi:hypothetical protein